MPDKRDDIKIRRRKVSEKSSSNSVRVKKKAGIGMDIDPTKKNRRVVDFDRNRSSEKRNFRRNRDYYAGADIENESDEYSFDEGYRRNRKRTKRNLFIFRRGFLRRFLGIALALILIFGSAGFLYVRSITSEMPMLTKQMVRESYINKNPIPISKIPKNLQNAVIAVEDHRFYEHGGVDYMSMIRASISTLTGGKRQGGSTIDMQVSKNLLTSNEVSIKRKIQDMYNAYRLNKIMTKKEILEAYLNNIYMGKSAYGVQAGSQLYFGKDVWKLGFGECTMLAGITNNPSLYQNYEEAKKRQGLILYRMYKLGYIKEYVYKAQLLRDTPFKSEID